MCSELLGALLDWLQLAVALGAVFVAYRGVDAWRAQLRGQAKQSTAIEIATAIGNLHVEFFNQRAPLILPWEWKREDGSSGDDDSAAKREGRALASRYKEVNRSIMAVHNLRGKALSVLGADCAQSLEHLTRTAMKLELVWNNYIRLLGAEDLRNDETITKVRASAFVAGTNLKPDDDLSREVQAKFDAVINKLNPFLHVR